MATTERELLTRKRDLLLRRKALLEGQMNTGEVQVTDIQKYGEALAKGENIGFQEQRFEGEPDFRGELHQPNLTMGEMGASALEHAPEDATNIVSGLAQAVTHPIETAKGLGGMALGGLEKLIPGEQKQEQKFDFLVDHYKNKYGSIESAKRAFAIEPISTLMDLSIVLGGSSMILKNAGLARTANAVSKAGKVVDPVLGVAKGVKGVGKGVGKVAEETLGITTGAGRAAIREAYRVEYPSMSALQAARHPVDFWEADQEVE